MVSTFLNVVFKPSLKIGVYAFQHLKINCCHFLLDCLLQIGQGARFVSTDIWFEVSPQNEILNISHKIVRTDSRLNLISRACLRAERPGLRFSACLALSLFSGFPTVLLGPDGFFFTILPVVLRLRIHLRIVLRLGTVSRRPRLKWTRKSRCTTVTDSPFCIYAS